MNKNNCSYRNVYCRICNGLVDTNHIGVDHLWREWCKCDNPMFDVEVVECNKTTVHFH